MRDRGAGDVVERGALVNVYSLCHRVSPLLAWLGGSFSCSARYGGVRSAIARKISFITGCMLEIWCREITHMNDGSYISVNRTASLKPLLKTEGIVAYYLTILRHRVEP